MVDHQHFLARIQAEADPRLPQSIYADWLEEQGDPRAELLRLAVGVREWPKGEIIHESDYNPGAFRNMLQAWTNGDGSRKQWAIDGRIPRVAGNRISDYWYWKEPTDPLEYGKFLTAIARLKALNFSKTNQ